MKKGRNRTFFIFLKQENQRHMRETMNNIKHLNEVVDKFVPKLR